jgi:hypothetical protein
MNTPLRNICASLGFAIALTVSGAMAHAMPSVQAADQEEQRAIDDIAQGSDALVGGQQHAALVAVERAQTTLLNAQQAGSYTAPKAADALDRAHAEIVQGKLHQAADTLHTAEGALRTPDIG